MADRKEKFYRNVPGKYYVDCTCLDHDACIFVAPDLFRRDEDRGSYYVCKQPENPEQERQMREAIDGCPVGAIGEDGDLPDSEYWFNPEYPPDTGNPAIGIDWLLYRQVGTSFGGLKCVIATDASGILTRLGRTAASFFNYSDEDAVGKLHYSAFHDTEEMKACANDPAFKVRMLRPGFTEDDWTIVPGGKASRFRARVTLVPLWEAGRGSKITGYLALYRRLYPQD